MNCTITLTHPNCTTTFSNNAANKHLDGLTYDLIATDGKHAITATVNVKNITGEFHGGICVFLGTSHKFEMVGSATFWGEDDIGTRVNITHTAP